MINQPKELREVRDYKGEKIEVIFRKLRPVEESNGKYPALKPGVTIEGGIRLERDVAVPLRDGTIIYTDIFRPDGAGNLPAIIAWSPYGKSGLRVEGIWGGPAGSIPGVPMGTVSENTKTEGPDPDYWCRHGYAVINPDARGVGNSEGDVAFWGDSEGKDCHDLIEWVAARDWSNSRVGMAGNSWLAIAQWFTAAEQPPHLAAIAPWEGATDYYRDLLCRGGVPETAFIELIYGGMFGPGRMEDMVAMIHKYPLMNRYWESKIARLDKISVPAYITAGWSHFHLRGSIEGFRRISSTNKWLRVHRDFEWPDFYAPENLEDLRRFFDRYLKGFHNGWEMTPRVRLDVMDAFDVDYCLRRPEKEFPLARTRYEKLFLNAKTGKLSTRPVRQGSSISYEAAKGLATFDMRFEEDTELTGYMKLRLWVEASGSDDMDIFVAIQKLDEESNFLPTLVLGYPHPGASGLLRVSHRELDEVRSTPAEPFHPYRREQLLKLKEIVPVEIDIWPTSRFWHKGEQLRVAVSGHYTRAQGWPEPFGWETRNRGQHIIHAGGKYDSYLLVPRVRSY